MSRPGRRVYQHHHFDSTRWDYFEPRAGDIVIATSYKAGTTWTQAIVAHLIFQDGRLPGPVAEISPWLDMRTRPLEGVLNTLRAQTHRRFIKTHLPLDGIEFREDTRYVYVARDARDVFMSLWNHYKNHTDEALRAMNQTPGRVGDELPPPPDDIREFWRNWITRGWFDFESDGWPYWSHLYNVQSWWEARNEPNLLMLHFADMIEDTEREARRLAAFLDIEVPEETWPLIVKAVSFAEMKKRGEQYAPGGGSFWKGGASTFLNEGTNGRWRDVLTADDLALYDAACEKVLTPECRDWLENGRHAAGRGDVAERHSPGRFERP